jgi:hypothetical protein
MRRRMRRRMDEEEDEEEEEEEEEEAEEEKEAEKEEEEEKEEEAEGEEKEEIQRRSSACSQHPPRLASLDVRQHLLPPGNPRQVRHIRVDNVDVARARAEPPLVRHRIELLDVPNVRAGQNMLKTSQGGN